MPNQPKYPLLAARVPSDAAQELRELAEETGLRTGELIAEMVRAVGKRYRQRGRALSRDAARRRIIDRPSVKSTSRTQRKNGVRPHRHAAASRRAG